MADAGGVSRRDFLRLGLAAGPASLVAACGWDGGALLEPRLRVVEPDQRLGGREDPSLQPRLAPRVSGLGAHAGAGVPRLFDHLEPQRRLSRSAGGLGARGGRPGADAGAAHAADAAGDAARHLHGEAPLRRGLDRRSPPGPACRFRPSSPMVEPLPEARYLRFDSFDSGYSNGWDLASAMHPQTILAYAQNDRPLPRTGRAAPAVLAGQARLQAHQVPHRDDLHRRAARRVLGGPGVSLARRSLTLSSRPPAPG